MTSRRRCRKSKRKTTTIVQHSEGLVSGWVNRTTTAVGTRVASVYCDFCRRLDYMPSFRPALPLDDSQLLSLLSLILTSPHFPYLPTSFSFHSSTSSSMCDRYKSEAKKSSMFFFFRLENDNLGLYALKLHQSY